MDQEFYVKQVQQLVARGRLKEAFDTLIVLSPELEPAYQQDVTLLSSQFHTIIKQQRLNLVDDNVPLNKVIFGVLELLSEIKSDTESPILNSPLQVVAINKGYILFQFNHSVVVKFKTAFEQLAVFFDSPNASEEEVVEVTTYLQQLILLNGELTDLQEITQRAKDDYRDLIDIQRAERKISYVLNNMPLSEAATQLTAIQKLKQRFHTTGKQSFWWWVLAIAVIAGLLLVLSLQVSKL